MKKSAARRRVASFDASILGCGTADRAGGKSVSLGRFKNCKPLNLKPLRDHGVEDEPCVLLRAGLFGMLRWLGHTCFSFRLR
jgi:hypothetical protein